MVAITPPPPLTMKNFRSNYRVIIFFSRGEFAWEGGDTLLKNGYKPFPEPMRNYPEKLNQNCSVVCEILWFRHPVALS